MLRVQESDGLHVCALCNSTFPSEQELTEHFSSTCEVKVEDEPLDSEKFEQLTKPVRGRMKLHVCALCNSIFPTDVELTEHMNSHCDVQVKDERNESENDQQIKESNSVKSVGRPTRKRVCALCKKTFRNADELSQHLMSHGETEEQDGGMDCEKDEQWVVKEEIKSIKTVQKEMALRKSIVSCAEKRSENLVFRELKTNVKEEAHVCALCNKILTSDGELMEHLRLNCGVEVREEPTDCKKEKQLTVNEEIKSVQIETALCNSFLPSVEQLPENLSSPCEVNVKTEPMDYEKYDQLVIKSNLEAIKAIQRRGEKANPGKYKCQMCDKTYTLKGSLYQHERTHSTDKHKCEYCGREFNQKHQLKSHIITKHSTERPYQCKVCEKAFPMKHILLMHMKGHGEKSFKCETCGKGFATKVLLVEHVRTHDPHSTYPCTYCDKAFAHGTNLKRHIQYWHTNDRPYKCNLCSKAYVQKRELTRHLKAHEIKKQKTKRKEKEDKPYQCTLCNKTFRGKTELEHHIAVHTGVKPHKCNVCDKSFYKKEHLKNHKVVHEETQGYKCDLCETRTKHRRNLVAHVRLKHCPIE